MGLLSQDHNNDFIPYIKDKYHVAVGVSHGDLYWDGLGKYDGGTIGDHIAAEIGNCRLIDWDSMREQVKIVVKIMLGQYFTRKHSNGLYKKFIFEWKQTDTGWVCHVRDDIRNSHIKIILKHKQYGILQKTKNAISEMAQFLRH